MKKTLAIVLALVMMLAFVACGKKAAPAELYTTESDFLEAGYEGDCVNTNAYTLVLGGDGNYILEQGFFVNQVSGAIVFFTKTVYNGTYTATEKDADGIKTVTLAAPTAGFVNMNGGITTSAEDAEFLKEMPLNTVKVDTTSGTIILD